MSALTSKRTYNDLCGIARALDVVGERWALLVVRELLLGPKRFTDLRKGLPHVGPDILAQRLRELEASGVLARRTLGPPAGARVYELTERGAVLEPVILELGRWGTAVPFPGGAELGVDSAVLALKTVFDPEAAGKTSLTLALTLDGQPFRIRLEAGKLEVERGEAPDAGVGLATDPNTLSQILWRGLRIEDAERSGSAVVTGARRNLARALRPFQMSE
jgi:DNA-binding HxlR family transcriptional regulator